MDFTAVLFLIMGIGLGFAFGWLLKKNNQSTNESAIDATALNSEIASLKARLDAAAENYKEQKQQIEQLTAQKEQLLSHNSQLTANNQNVEQKLKEQKQEVEKLQEKFTLEFQNVANKLLKENL